MTRVLVLGQGTRAFLAVIRSLGRQGLQVHVGMCPDDDLALRSRYVARRHILAPFEGTGEAWLASVQRVLSHEPFALLLACDDQSMIPIQLHRECLGELTNVYAYSPEVYGVAFDKVESTRLAERLGINVAAQRELDESVTADELLAELGLPVVFKPPSSFDESNLDSRREVVRARTPLEVAGRLEEFKRFGRGLAQENVVGVGVGVELIAHEGLVLVAFQHERVHEPLEGGGSSYRRSVALDPALLGAAKKLIEALGYTGVAMIEFKRDPRSGRWIFIEINARFWGSLPLAVAAGADFPWYLYQLLVDGRTRFPTEYRRGLYARSLLADFYWLGSNLRADHADSTLATVPHRRVAAELFNVLAFRERVDSLSWDDWRPFTGELMLVVGAVTGKAASVACHLFANSFAVRPFRAARVRARVREARCILFLCYGNICRSPFAAEYASAVLGERVTVLSSGVHPETGRESPAVACKVAGSMGIDLTQHRSSVLDANTVRRADVIFVFDAKNEAILAESFPDALPKVAQLDTLAPRGRGEIEDPYGHGESAFVAAYERIKACLDRIHA